METSPVERTWKPTTAGILSIVAGGIDLTLGTWVAALGTIGAPALGIRAIGIGAIGAPLIVLGIVAIIGGSFALRRRIWGLALAGAICALMWPMSVLGVLAIVLIALSKDEFV